MTTTLTTLRRSTLALALAAFAAWPAFAADWPGAAPQASQDLPDYVPQRLNAIYATDKDRPMATQWVRMNRLDAQLAALRVHAGNPPPRFKNDAQLQAARADALRLAISLTEATASSDISAELTLRSAIALSIAHNFGAPEASAMADARFERALAKAPELPAGLLEYGIHLANTNRPQEALVPLRRAVAHGDDNARWPLAISLASLGQRAEALTELDALQASQPAAGTRYPLAATRALLRAGG
jgi:predicted Zn-dependent protease